MRYGSRAIDEYSGTSYEHRRAWVEDKVLWLSSVFAIGICAYAVMSNHMHLARRVVKEKIKSTLRAIVRDGFCLEFLRTSYSFLLLKKSSQEMPLAAKVFNRTKRLSLWAPIALSFQIYPSNFHSNDFPARRPPPFTPKTSLFVLKLQMR
jgi:hypothetical protein